MALNILVIVSACILFAVLTYLYSGFIGNFVINTIKFLKEEGKEDNKNEINK